MPFFVTPTGYSCHYELHGDGPDKIILIMGFACCKNYWSGLVERLLQWGGTSDKAYQVCVFDSRGFGLSGDALARYSSSSLALDTRALLMHLGWIRAERALLQKDLQAHHSRMKAFERASAINYQPPPLHVVGWSMGGMIAQELTLDLVHWIEQRRKEHGADYKCADFRSVVIAASSRGGFTHVGEKHDAEPILLSTGATSRKNSFDNSMNSGGASLSLLSRCLRRSRKQAGRYGWGMAWPLRNVPPLDGLVRMFKCVFLSLYHSRIERVLELHYSQAYLEAPYVQDKAIASDGKAANRDGKKSVAPPSSALSHLPLASAALTSSAKNTIVVRTDASTGGYQVSQQEDEQQPLADEDGEQDTKELAEREFATEPSSPRPLIHRENSFRSAEPEEEQLLSPMEAAQPAVTLEMTPAQKKRVLRREEGHPDEQDHHTESAGLDKRAGESKEEVEARYDASGFSTPIRSGLPPRRTPSFPSSYAAAFNNGQPPAAQSHDRTNERPLLVTASSNSSLHGPSSPTSPSSRSSISSSTARPLTNRDVLASSYLLRAPFDRYILLYAFSLFGHATTCLTHHVSRRRIREFNAQLRAASQRRDAHLLRCLVITGSSDILVHPSNSYHLSEQLGCPLYVLDGVGHMLHVEQPDAFAQLLHAHFTRTPVEHLQAYTHPTTSLLAPSPARTKRTVRGATPPPPLMSRNLSASSIASNAPDGAANLTVTRLGEEEGADRSEDGGAAGGEDISADERALIAARAASSRRNSFLIQIDDGSGGVGTPRGRSSMTPSVANRARSDSLSSLHRGGSASTLSLLSRAGDQSRRGSFVDLRKESTTRRRREGGCCAKVISTCFFLPIQTAASLTRLALAVPKTGVHYLLHPLDVFSIPSHIFARVKSSLGGRVWKKTSGRADAGIAAEGDEETQLARVVV
jgi:pimeloyl-ACP methyl ester carboxylesterase